jgi:hypothetical protein
MREEGTALENESKDKVNGETEVFGVQKVRKEVKIWSMEELCSQSNLVDRLMDAAERREIRLVEDDKLSPEVAARVVDDLLRVADGGFVREQVTSRRR